VRRREEERRKKQDQEVTMNHTRGCRFAFFGAVHHTDSSND
jgi:hypothetical protein